MSVTAIAIGPPLLPSKSQSHQTTTSFHRRSKPVFMCLPQNDGVNQLRSRPNCFNVIAFEGEFRQEMTSTNNNSNSDVRKLCRDGRLQEALDSLHYMNEMCIEIEFHTYATFLQACANTKALRQAKRLHSLIISTAADQEILLADRLVNTYAKCGSLKDARLVFDKMPKQNVLLWNVMLLAYVNHGFYEEALRLYRQMPVAGIKPDYYTFPCVLKACAGLSALPQGKEIHAHVIRTGFEFQTHVRNTLVTMYGVCGNLKDARQVFDKMCQRNAITWNAMIADACQVFDKMCQRDVITWNAMIAGYVQDGHFEDALKLFRQMSRTETKPDLVTVITIVPACACLGALKEGKGIHAYTIRCGLDGNVLIGNALIDMYAKCCNVKDAVRVFENMSQRDVISWTAMISGYGENEKYEEALGLFNRMELAGAKADVVTITSILSVCASIADLEQGKYVHDYILRNGIKLDISAKNALVDMYGKCKSIENARRVFDKISPKDVISWSTMIAVYHQIRYCNEALKLFREMQLSIKPNSVTIISVLSACADLAALQQGRETHGHIIRNGLSSNVFVGNAIIDMYVKCGNMKYAHRLFDKMSKTDVTSWTVMIGGYGMQGNGKDALSLFYQMQQAGIKPDGVTFIAILCACSRAGLVAEGWHYFRQMSFEYCIKPNLKHYACMVDLLGRAGLLNEALNFIKELPVEPDVGIWGALLGACRIHHNINLGEYAASRIFELEADNVGYYLLLSNLYGDAGRWDAVAKVRTMMKGRNLIKNPGCSWIEVKGTVHAFLVGDRAHPQAYQIYAIVDSWAARMKEAGYVPSPSFVLQNELDAATKEDVLCGHTEKLAIAFGLINTSPGTPLRITKNLQMCSDCHNATKFVSKIVRREITVKDTSYWHLFKDGLCSCGCYE